jgi:hypothetical protein
MSDIIFLNKAWKFLKLKLISDLNGKKKMYSKLSELLSNVQVYFSDSFHTTFTNSQTFATNNCKNVTTDFAVNAYVSLHV